MPDDLTIRRLTSDDAEIVGWALGTAATWRDPDAAPPLNDVLRHPDLVRYHAGWGRPGDGGVAAEIDGELAGAAFYRTFTADDHGYGYVDETTPEMGIAVTADRRRRGIGARLLTAVDDSARADGHRRLSLSVNTDNPALGLYLAHGYVEVRRGDDDVVMVLDL